MMKYLVIFTVAFGILSASAIPALQRHPGISTKKDSGHLIREIIQLIEELAQEYAPILESDLKDLEDFLENSWEKLGPELGPIIAEIGPQLLENLDQLLDFIAKEQLQYLLKNREKFGELIQDLLDAYNSYKSGDNAAASQSLSAAAKLIISLSRGFYGDISPGIGKFFQWLSEELKKYVTPELAKEIAEFCVELAHNLDTTFQQIYKDALTFAKQHSEQIAQLLQDILDLFHHGKLPAISDVDVTRPCIDWREAWKLLVNVEDLIQTTLKLVLTDFHSFNSWLKSEFQTQQNLIDPLTNILLSFVKTAIPPVLTLVTAVVDEAEPFIAAHQSDFAELETLIGTEIKALENGDKPLAEQTLGQIIKLGSKLGLEFAKAVKPALQTFLQWAKPALKQLSDEIQPYWTELKPIIEEGTRFFIGDLAQLLKDLPSFLETSLPKLKDIINELHHLFKPCF